jgi:hypothetical protein
VPTYIEALENTKYIPNVVILFKSEFFAIRQPNSGLTIDSDKVGLVSALTVNPTAIDPFRASSTTSNYSFKILDTNGIITAFLNGDNKFFQGEPVTIWVGRYGTKVADQMDFADYLELPTVYVNKWNKVENAYSFQAVEARDRLSTGAFNVVAKLGVDIVAGTTEITMQDVSTLPTNGTIKIDDEFISYTGIIGLNLQSCIRGERDSTPVAHDGGSDVFLVQEIEANPINILLQLLISSGGGGSYDLLSDGAGIDETLVDISQMEDVRDEFFSSYTYSFAIFKIESLKRFIEDELLYPLGIRLRSNSNGKIGLALIDRNIFEIDAPILNHDNMTKDPEFIVEDTKINNQLRVFWDYSEAADEFMKVTEYTDADSITDYGVKDWKEVSFKGIKASLSGQAIVDAFGLLFINRFKDPRPVIKVAAFLSTSNSNLGDKIDLESNLIPNDQGELNFASTLEIVQRAINHETGDCLFQLAFTSFTGVRLCYISPSDLVISHASQKIITLGAGRGDNYRRGWMMRLYDNTARDDADSQVNEILSVVGDVITFVDNWATTLVNSQHRIRFADYDEGITVQQKRFCYISDGTNDFDDGKQPYQISFG